MEQFIHVKVEPVDEHAQAPPVLPQRSDSSTNATVQNEKTTVEAQAELITHLNLEVGRLNKVILCETAKPEKVSKTLRMLSDRNKADNNMHAISQRNQLAIQAATHQQLEQAKHNVRDLSASLQAVRAENTALHHNLAKAEQQTHVVSQNLDGAKLEIADLKKTVETMKQEKLATTGRLNLKAMEQKQSIGNLHSMNEQLQTLKAENEKLKIENAELKTPTTQSEEVKIKEAALQKVTEELNGARAINAFLQALWRKSEERVDMAFGEFCANKKHKADENGQE